MLLNSPVDTPLQPREQVAEAVLTSRREATEDEDDCVVDDVRRDGSQQPVVEDEPEHHHADEPRVDPADEAEVLVAVTESDACRHDGRAE